MNSALLPLPNVVYKIIFRFSTSISIGGQDELIFDGGSMVINEEGELAQFAGFFNEVLFPVEVNASHKHKSRITVSDLTLPQHTGTNLSGPCIKYA